MPLSDVCTMLILEKELGSTNTQSNLNGLNIFETLEICSRHGYFEPLRISHGARSEGKW